jgi:peptidylprolyl isomerase
VFGSVIKGQEVVDSIQQNDTIEKLEIIRVGKDAEKFATGQAAFDAIVAEQEKEKNAARLEADKELKAKIEKKWPKAVKTRSGLLYVVEEEGSGPTPERGATIKAHYTGRLLSNNKKFDSSYDRGEPITFPVGTGRVIKGWDEALLAMKKGEKRTLIIPPDLAYGSRGAGGVIPPDAWLVFDVELVDF